MVNIDTKKHNYIESFYLVSTLINESYNPHPVQFITFIQYSALRATFMLNGL